MMHKGLLLVETHAGGWCFRVNIRPSTTLKKPVFQPNEHFYCLKRIMRAKCNEIQ